MPIILADSVFIDADRFVGADAFKNIYYTKKNVLYKKTKDTTLSFSSVSLGDMTTIDIKNPLKILVFFQDHNAIALLDNNLSILGESKQFNRRNINLNVTFAQLASDDKIWLYSNDDSTLHLYSYQLDKIVESSPPVYFYREDFIPNEMVSTYKNCWLVNNGYVLQFDEYGYFKKQFALNGIKDLKRTNKYFYWLKDGFLLRSDLKTEPNKLLPIRPISIQSYDVQNDEIYIFDGKKVFIYELN